MILPTSSSRYSRRRFLRQLVGAGALAATGLEPLLAGDVPATPQPFRFAFVTDLHLIQNGALRSADGIAACLTAVEKLDPRPEFILVGGDLVHVARDLTVTQAEESLDLFLKIWNDHTSLPAHWVFGNHDLVGTSNPSVLPGDKHYAKGLFRDRFQLPNLFYSFDHLGWHFVILDDIDPLPNRSYIGELFSDELQFLRADLDAHRTVPTIISCHIPTLSNLPMELSIAHAISGRPTPPLKNPKSLVCTNAQDLFADLPGHNIRAVLSGHLHFLENLTQNGIPFVNCGAVCGNYWHGPMYGCPEGFGVVDLDADGSVAFDYHPYGWKA